MPEWKWRPGMRKHPKRQTLGALCIRIASRQLQGCFQAVIELLFEGVGQRTDGLADVRLLRRQEVVAGDQRGIAEARGRFGSRIDEDVTWVAAATQITRDHGDNGLAESLVVSVVLHHDRGANLGPRRI